MGGWLYGWIIALSSYIVSGISYNTSATPRLRSLYIVLLFERRAISKGDVTGLIIGTTGLFPRHTSQEIL